MATIYYGHSGFHARDAAGAVVRPSAWMAEMLEAAQVVVDFGDVPPDFDVDLEGEWDVACRRHGVCDEVREAGLSAIRARSDAVMWNGPRV
jgi:hypothetical protein